MAQAFPGPAPSPGTCLRLAQQQTQTYLMNRERLFGPGCMVCRTDISKKAQKDLLKDLASSDSPPKLIEKPGEKKPFECGGCGKRYYTRHGWEKGHLPCIGLINLDRKPTIPCTECGKLFQEEKDMHAHRKMVHVMYVPLDVPCSICGKMFQNMHDYRAHRLTDEAHQSLQK